MAFKDARRTINYGFQNESFKFKVSELSGEDINLCFQCGGCSSGCPLAEEMDFLPSKIVRMIQLGREEALDSETIWVCSTCFNCEVRCPRGIDVANIMEALRQLKLRKKYSHVSLDSLEKSKIRTLPQIAIISNQRKLSA
ncbi:4Fe-4S dicluster domain-containing protein [Candidatus Bathyarchaeota archaeon]|nr:4Fe-4S dicluster domain-containing protein [Candidatus Bathyarchaeota archaeon]